MERVVFVEDAVPLMLLMCFPSMPYSKFAQENAGNAHKAKESLLFSSNDLYHG